MQMRWKRRSAMRSRTETGQPDGADGITHRVRIHYRYSYSEPVTSLRHRLLVVPPDIHGRQVLLGHGLEVRGATPGPRVTEAWDAFGNRMYRIEADHIAHAVDFEAQFRVASMRRAPPASSVDWQPFRAPTALTAPDRRLRRVARSLRAASPAGDALALAEAAHQWAGQAIVSRAGLTDYRTPAALALHLGSGVCQDFAHILLVVLRLLEIPARYVSGHLPGEGPPHAWIEALVGDQVVGFDPSHRRRTDDRYITIAVGRDYADVTPTSGVFSGAARGALSYTKRTERLASVGGVAA
jgi:transglutaminase-like putative cysteine protease